ncbi:hypothetical protein PRUPE_4G097400 [Prunus persica]|uniref:Uncharacterized protein n=1 Tax=Prunus persica TaxID=3760 RepID=A0A251PI87_PRUPE|nr:hypothetical protein PRUPE_4G097400 [Prunus persica]
MASQSQSAKIIFWINSSLHLQQPIKVVIEVLQSINLPFFIAIVTKCIDTNVKVPYWILNKFPARCGKGVSEARIWLIFPPYGLNTNPVLPSLIIFFHKHANPSLEIGV